MSPASRIALWVARWWAARSLGVIHWTGRRLGRLVLMLSAGYRRKVTDNLSQAGLLDAARLRDSAHHAGMLVTESPFIWFRPPAEVIERTQCADASLLAESMKSGRGLILLTPHLGSFEVAARYCASFGPLTALYKPPKQPGLRNLLEAARPGANLQTAPANLSGVRQLLRALKRGEAVGILPDQVPDAGNGDWAPFFGRDAYTMTLPAKLAAATGAPVMMIAAQRQVGAGWLVRVELLAEPPSPAAINRAMEAMIRRCPEQYLWGYNRYKAPRALMQDSA
jgi:Kdo2-lipid IVA lauroyltransferase/acyltransferase